jgi:hypothetical protein
MRLNRTDAFASVAVGVAVLVFAMWLADVAMPGTGSVRTVGAVVLGLGWLASAVAVVPNFDELIHASRLYLVVTGVLGVAAMVAGVIVLVNANEAMLALLVSVTVALWVLATVRHTVATRHREQPALVHGEFAGAVEDRERVGTTSEPR